MKHYTDDEINDILSNFLTSSFGVKITAILNQLIRERDEARGGALKPSEAEEIKSNILKSQDKVDGAITLEKVKEWREEIEPFDAGHITIVCSDLYPRLDWLIQEVERLKKGEFICKKCGLRKDAEFKKGDF